MRLSRSLVPLAVILLGAAILPSCATNRSPGSATGVASTPADTGTHTLAPSPEGSASASAPGTDWPETLECDVMLEPSVDTELRERGLAPAPKQWAQFGFEPSLAAVECPWGAPGATTTEAYYAWARLAPGERDEFIALIVENGYAIEESERGAWLVTPAELEGGGAGATLITTEWVVFADSRAQIDDIVWVR